MNKTYTIAAIALVASSFATGCAAGAADCTDVDCSDYDVESAEVVNDFEQQPSETDRVSATEARDPQLRRFPLTIAPLQDWVLRMDAGEADACDMRFARYVAGKNQELSLRDCEDSVIANIVAVDDDGPILVPIDRFNAEETKWMLLGLDISEDNPLTVEQITMVAEAHDASLSRSITAGAHDAELEQQAPYQAEALEREFQSVN